MKVSPLLLLTLLVSLAGLRGQTIEWGSQVFSQIVNSKGDALDNSYVFEVGAFANTFTPNESNTDSWFDNWQAFDRAGYSEANGYFTSTVEMNDDGSSQSAFMTAGALSFEGLEAYIWVRNSETPSPTTEWFLVKSPQWVFPDANIECCGNALPVQWSMGDLTGTNTPVWGSQMGTDGSGHFTVDGIYDLQTFTFVPEPSTTILAFLFCGFLLTRRSRTH